MRPVDHVQSSEETTAAAREQEHMYGAGYALSGWGLVKVTHNPGSGRIVPHALPESAFWSQARARNRTGREAPQAAPLITGLRGLQLSPHHELHVAAQPAGPGIWHAAVLLRALRV